jgi:hypothetical protein
VCENWAEVTKMRGVQGRLGRRPLQIWQEYTVTVFYASILAWVKEKFHHFCVPIPQPDVTLYKIKTKRAYFALFIIFYL